MGEAISVASTVAVAIFDCLYANKSSDKTHRKIEHSSMYSTPSPSSLLFFPLFSVDRVGNRDPKRMRKYWEWWEEKAATMLVPEKKDNLDQHKNYFPITHTFLDARSTLNFTFHLHQTSHQVFVRQFSMHSKAEHARTTMWNRKKSTHEQFLYTSIYLCDILGKSEK